MSRNSLSGVSICGVSVRMPARMLDWGFEMLLAFGIPDFPWDTASLSGLTGTDSEPKPIQLVRPKASTPAADANLPRAFLV
jgi:hypothetical protein